MMSNQHPFMHFDVIPDYRQQGKVEHKLTDIILLTICAEFSGQDDWKAFIYRNANDFPCNKTFSIPYYVK